MKEGMLNTIKGKLERLIKSPNNLEQKKELHLRCVSDTRANEKHPKRNGDSFLVNEKERAAAVFDGLSEPYGDEIASRTCKQYASDNLPRIKNGMSVREALNILKKIFIEADEVVAQSEELAEEREFLQSMGEIRGHNKPGTTATLFKIHTDSEGENWGLVANVGNSRLYKIEEKGNLTQITEDDDYLVMMYPDENERARVSRKISTVKQIEELDAKEQLFLKEVSSVLTMTIGGKDADPSVHSFKIKKGDRFLLLTDGIHSNLTTDEIEQIIKESKTIEEAKKKLIEKALLHSRPGSGGGIRTHPDDMTVVIVEVEAKNPETAKEAEEKRVENIREKLHQALE